MLLAIYLHEDLIQMPPPLRMLTHGLRSFSSDLGREHRTKPVPPVTHAFMTNVDATLVQQSSTLRNESGNRTYIITARRIILGDVLK